MGTHHIFSKSPIFGENVGDSKRHGEHAQQEVRNDQVHYEDVLSRHFCLEEGIALEIKDIRNNNCYIHVLKPYII